MQSDENIAMSVYLRFLANGEEINVDVTSPGAKEAFERGKALTGASSASSISPASIATIPSAVA